jgi:WD40 repeat protein
MDTCQQCGAMLQLRQRYRAIHVLGQGQLSRTLLAIDQINSLQCVIQQSWNPAINPALIARLQEIGKHPQLPTMLDAFEQEGMHYLIQEYIEGESLAVAIATQAFFTSIQVWQILESVLPILHWLHIHDVIHRDIKPANIIQRQSSEFMLVDLGSAMLSHDRTLPTAIGSPEYTAPEQLRGNAIFASDLYSLGVVCIQSLTGMQPFHLFDATEHRWIWRSYWQPELGSSEKDLDCLAQILDRLIEPSPSQRFASAALVIARIEQLRGKKIALPSPAPKFFWQNTATLIGHSGLFASVTAVAISPDQRYLASASEDRTVRLWDLDAGKEIRVLQGHSQFVQTVAFHPHYSDLLISAGRDRQIIFWDWQTSRTIRTLTGHTQQIHAIAFSPDGTLIASGSADKTIKLWNLDGELIKTFNVHRLAVNAIAFHPTAPLIASASADATLCLWNLDGEKVRTFSGHTQAVRTLAFNPSGQLLASGGEDKTIRLWDMVSGKCLRILAGHSWSVAALIFATNRLLISGSWDTTLKVWQIDTGVEITQLVGHTDSVTSVALSRQKLPDDAIASTLNDAVLISGSRDQTIKRWQFSVP